MKIKEAIMEMKILIYFIPIFIAIPNEGHSLIPSNTIESLNDTIGNNIGKRIKKEQLNIDSLNVPYKRMDCSR